MKQVAIKSLRMKKKSIKKDELRSMTHLLQNPNIEIQYGGFDVEDSPILV